MPRAKKIQPEKMIKEVKKGILEAIVMKLKSLLGL